jgi:hypothetical protein
MFNSKPNMYKHRKHVCLPKHEKHNQESHIQEMELKLKEIGTKYLELEKSYSSVLKENEYLKKTIDELTPFKHNYISMLEKTYESNSKVMEINSETTKLNAESYIKSLSTIKYISKRLNRAPPLKYQQDEIVGLLEYNVSKKYKPIDYIIYNHNIKKLDKWVGDIIVQLYKKENPFDQSIWATDSSRFSYLICDVIKCASGTRNEWITDKSGIKITEIIINPTLELLYNMINTYLNETIDYDVDGLSINEVMKITSNRQKSTEIMKEIKDNTFHKEVLKYITPFLSADMIKIEDTINKTINDEWEIRQKTAKKKTKKDIMTDEYEEYDAPKKKKNIEDNRKKKK